MRICLMLLMTLWLNITHAAVPNFDDIEAEEDYLAVEQAFQPVVKASDGHVHMSFTIADGYYLYKKRLSVNSGNNTPIVTGDLAFNKAAEIKNDPNFGRVEIFHQAVSVDVPVYASRAQDVGKDWPVNVIYQGCSQEGLCYPPQTIKTQLKFLAVPPVNLVKNEAVEITSSTSITPKTDTNNANSLAEFLQGSSFGLIIATFLVLGIGLSFTPCVLPMIPILSGIIAGQGQGLSAKRGFLLSLSYVVGMATTYALAGMAVGHFGASANLAAWMQSPVVLSIFAFIFVLLALAMFCFYELELPAFI